MDNRDYGGADGFDFTLTARTLDDFGTQCRELQTSPDSSLVKTTVCERFTRQGLVMLRGSTLREVTAAGVTSRVLQDANEFAAALRDCFGIGFLPRRTCGCGAGASISRIRPSRRHRSRHRAGDAGTAVTRAGAESAIGRSLQARIGRVLQ